MSEHNDEQQSSPGITIDQSFLRTYYKGWIIAIQGFLSMLVLICSAWGSLANSNLSWLGWIQFVSASAFVFSIILFIVYLLSLPQKLPASVPTSLIEMIYNAVYALFYLICFIISCAKGYWWSSIQATAVFSFACIAAFVLQTYWKWYEYSLSRRPARSGEARSDDAAKPPPSVEIGDIYWTNNLHFDTLEPVVKEDGLSRDYCNKKTLTYQKKQIYIFSGFFFIWFFLSYYLWLIDWFSYFQNHSIIPKIGLKIQKKKLEKSKKYF